MTDSGPVGSTVPSRQLARLLRKLRMEAGVTAVEAADAMEWSRQKFYRHENGVTPLRVVDIRALASLYRASPDMIDLLVSLAGEAKARGWWHSYGDAMPDWFELYVGLEAAAKHLRQFEPSMIPGLLQTAAYAEAVFRLNGLSEEEIRRKVGLRMERQRLLTRDSPQAPTLHVFLEEWVLRRPIADRTGMLGQLDHLRKVQQRAKNVEVRVIPMAAGPHHASQTGAFVVLDFPDDVPQEPTTIYAEGLSGALYLDKPAEVETYTRVWDWLNKLVLNKSDTLALIESIQKEYPT